MTDQPQQPGPGPDEAPRSGGPAGQGPYGAPGQQPYGTPGHGPGRQDAGSRYGTAAYDPRAVGQELAEPAGLGRLRRLTLISLAVYVLSSIPGLVATQNEELLRAQFEATPTAGLTEAQISQGIEAARMFGLATSLALLVVPVILYVIVYAGLRGANNWARILGTVFAALGIVSTVWSLFGVGMMMSVMPGLGVATLVFGLALVAVNIWWLIVAFSREVNAYVRARGGASGR